MHLLGLDGGPEDPMHLLETRMEPLGTQIELWRPRWSTGEPDGAMETQMRLLETVWIPVHLLETQMEP